jgi:hypothetical protein
MIGAIPIVAENRIREAIERGEFDCLEGMGEPLADIDGNHQPDWWLRKKLAREKLTAEEIASLLERLKTGEVFERTL